MCGRLPWHDFSQQMRKPRQHLGPLILQALRLYAKQIGSLLSALATQSGGSWTRPVPRAELATLGRFDVLLSFGFSAGSVKAPLLFAGRSSKKYVTSGRVILKLLDGHIVHGYRCRPNATRRDLPGSPASKKWLHNPRSESLSLS